FSSAAIDAKTSEFASGFLGLSSNQSSLFYSHQSPLFRVLFFWLNTMKKVEIFIVSAHTLLYFWCLLIHKRVLRSRERSVAVLVIGKESSSLRSLTLSMSLSACCVNATCSFPTPIFNARRGSRLNLT
ncbi:unnamed protein product, partial [Brassica oleracea var. botrytis]